jgi:hypothetical protein
MTTCSVCGGGHAEELCIVHDRVDQVLVRLDALHDQVGAANRRADAAHAKLAALESAQRPQPAAHVCDRRCDSENGHHSWPPPQPAPPGGGEPMKMLVDREWLRRKIETDPDDAECEAGGLHAPFVTPPAPGDAPDRCRRCGQPAVGLVSHREDLCAHCWTERRAGAPGDATGSDEGLVPLDDERLVERLYTIAQVAPLDHVSSVTVARAATRLDELRRERDTLRLTGNENAVNCDGNAKPHRLVAFIPDSGPCAACEQLARADAAEAKVAGIAGLVRKIGPNTVADCAHIIRKDWPLCAEILEAALTTPAQRSESNDGG